MPDAVPSESTLAIHNLQFAVSYALLHRTRIYIVTPTTEIQTAMWKLLPGLIPEGTLVSGHGALLPNRSVILVVAATHPIPEGEFALHLVGWSGVKDKSAAKAWRARASHTISTLRREF